MACTNVGRPQQGVPAIIGITILVKLPEVVVGEPAGHVLVVRSKELECAPVELVLGLHAQQQQRTPTTTHYKFCEPEFDGHVSCLDEYMITALDKYKIITARDSYNTITTY